MGSRKALKRRMRQVEAALALLQETLRGSLHRSAAAAPAAPPGDEEPSALWLSEVTADVLEHLGPAFGERLLLKVVTDPRTPAALAPPDSLRALLVQLLLACAEVLDGRAGWLEVRVGPAGEGEVAWRVAVDAPVTEAEEGAEEEARSGLVLRSTAGLGSALAACRRIGAELGVEAGAAGLTVELRVPRA